MLYLLRYVIFVEMLLHLILLHLMRYVLRYCYTWFMLHMYPNTTTYVSSYYLKKQLTDHDGVLVSDKDAI